MFYRYSVLFCNVDGYSSLDSELYIHLLFYIIFYIYLFGKNKLIPFVIKADESFRSVISLGRAFFLKKKQSLRRDFLDSKRSMDFFDKSITNFLNL
jgi:hypothetical protein